MSDVAVWLRDPYPPHARRAMFLPGPMSYGWVLGGTTKTTIAVSRADIHVAETYAHGMMVSIERSDGFLPWHGFITFRDLDDASPVSMLVAEDHRSALLAQARTARAWAEQKASAGSVMRRVLAEAEQRAIPPLLIEAPTIHGPYIEITPGANSIADFLDTVAEYSDWEWDVFHQPEAYGRAAGLRFQRRIGHDHRGDVSFYQGYHFKRAVLSQQKGGYLGAAMAIGGTGTVGARPAVEVNTSGMASEGTPTSARADDQTRFSPVHAGTQVLIEPQVTNQGALRAGAERANNAPENVREALTFTLWDGDNADGLAPVDVSLLELGSRYHVAFDNLALGLGVERNIRVIALSLSNAGSIEIVAEVEQDAA